MSILIAQFIWCAPPLPTCPHMSSLHLHFYSCPSLFPKDGDGVGNTLRIAKPSWLRDVASLRASVSHVGSVFLVFCWRTGHLGICESYLRKKHPKQTENGNFPWVTFSWPKGGNTGARRPLYLTQGPRALPLQSRGPQAAWGCHSVTRKSSVSSVLPWTLSTSTQERKEQFCFSEESGFNVAVHKQGDKLFFLLQGPFLIERCPLSLWRPLPSNHHCHSPPQKGRLRIKGRLRQRWTKPSVSWDHEFIRPAGVLLTLKQRSSWRWSWRFSAIVLPPERHQLKITHAQGLLWGCLPGTQWGRKDQFWPLLPSLPWFLCVIRGLFFVFFFFFFLVWLYDYIHFDYHSISLLFRNIGFICIFLL